MVHAIWVVLSPNTKTKKLITGTACYISAEVVVKRMSENKCQFWEIDERPPQSAVCKLLLLISLFVICWYAEWSVCRAPAWFSGSELKQQNCEVLRTESVWLENQAQSSNWREWKTNWVGLLLNYRFFVFDMPMPKMMWISKFFGIRNNLLWKLNWNCGVGRTLRVSAFFLHHLI